MYAKVKLPNPNKRRWTKKDKAMVIQAVKRGVITMGEAKKRYSMSEEEYKLWNKGIYTTKQLTEARNAA